MKIQRVRIIGFRSIKSLESDIPDFLCLVGGNNHGKSNILQAINIFFTAPKSLPDSYYYRWVGAESICSVTNTIEITLQFDDLSVQEKSLLNGYVVDDTIQLMRRYTNDVTGQLSEYKIFQMIPTDEWLKEDYAHYNNREILSKLPIYEFIPPTNKITKQIFLDAKKSYEEKYSGKIERSLQLMPVSAELKKVLDTVLPQFYFVPAIIDATDEIKSNGDTLFSKIINSTIERMVTNNQDFKTILGVLNDFWGRIEVQAKQGQISQIKQLEKLLKDELKQWNVEPKIILDKPDFTKLMAIQSHMILNDGIDTVVGGKGHGLQRSLIFALFKIIASEKRTDHQTHSFRTIIYAIEEPELYLHPHMCRATYEILKDLSEVDQILLCTHSQNFVDMEDYHDIILVKKEKEGTEVHHVQKDIFPGNLKQQFKMVKYFTPDRNEIFFSKKVILVEGLTERSLLPLLARRLSIFDHSVSIIDCAGKDNIPLFMVILNEFKIPYYVIHDEDPISPQYLPGGTLHDPKRLKNMKHTFDLNVTIESACDKSIGLVKKIPGEVENLLEITHGEADRYGKPYAATKKYIEESQLIPPDLEKLVREAYKMPSYE